MCLSTICGGLGSVSGRCCTFISLSIYLFLHSEWTSINKYKNVSCGMGKYCSTGNTVIGIKSENSYWKNEEVSRWKAQKRADAKLNWYISTLTEIFLNQKRINVCEHNFGLFVPSIERPLNFFGKIFPILFLFLGYPYIGTYPFHMKSPKCW